MRFIQLLLLYFCLATALPLSAATRITVYTMGPGDHFFEVMGHASLCVQDSANPKGVCYNYGTTDFKRPVGITWDVLRGRALFWVSRTTEGKMLRSYEKDDRTVYAQVLDIPQDQARELAAILRDNAKKENRSYLYHHLKDNCSTRPRDLLDWAVRGKLRAGAEVPLGLTWRELILEGLSGHWGIQVLVEIMFGRWTDGSPTIYQAMLMPDYLRRRVESTMGVTPMVVVSRKAELPQGSIWGGRRALLTLAGIILVVSFLPRGRWKERFTLTSWTVIGLLGMLVWGMVALTNLSELDYNECLLVFFPGDLLWPWLAPVWRLRYLWFRLGWLGVVLVLLVGGWLIQPLVAPLAIVLAGLLTLRPFNVIPFRSVHRGET